jgi:hypothetical protein
MGPRPACRKRAIVSRIVRTRRLIPGPEACSRLIDPARFDKMPRHAVQQLLTMAAISPADLRITRQFTGFPGTTLPAV